MFQCPHCRNSNSFWVRTINDTLIDNEGSVIKSEYIKDYHEPTTMICSHCGFEAQENKFIPKKEEE